MCESNALYFLVPTFADLQPVDDTSQFHANQFAYRSFRLGIWAKIYSTFFSGWIIYSYTVHLQGDMLTLHPGEWVSIRGPIPEIIGSLRWVCLPPLCGSDMSTAEFEFRQVEYNTSCCGARAKASPTIYPHQILNPRQQS